MNNPSIVGIDIPWFDEIITVERLPAENRSLPIGDITRQGGGKVSTALVAAARLGVPCAIVARLGLGRRDDYLVEDFARHGIDTSGICRQEGYRSGFSVVLNEQALAGRRILWQAPHTGPSAGEVAAREHLIQGARFLHLCRTGEGDLAAAALAKKHGVPVCFDGDFYSADIRQNLGAADILIGSEEFYGACFTGGTLADNLRQIKADYDLTVVIFTFGARGCTGLDEAGELFEVPAFSQNITVVDTVGAGDVFHGAWLAGRCHGMDTRQAARYASAVSAIKCTVPGGRAGIPDHAATLRYLEEGTFDPAPLLERQQLYQRLGQSL